MHEKLGALIERLSACADESGNWTISPEDVAGILGVEQVPFWRAIHETRDRISFADAIDGWSADTVGDLVTVLERPRPSKESFELYRKHKRRFKDEHA